MFGVDDAILIPALIAGGTGLVQGAMGMFGANAQADAAKEAAKIQTDGINNATNLQREQFNQQRQDLEPWRQAGVGALGRLNNLAPFEFGPEQFQADPGYHFRLKEGLKALERSASARGGLGGTNHARNVLQYGQEMGSQEYQNAFNRALTIYGTNLNRDQSLAGIGQTAVNNLAGAGQNFANSAGNLAVANANALAGGITGAANARTSGYVNGANALSNALAGGYNNFQNQQLLNKLLNGRSGTTFPGSVPASGAGYPMPTYQEIG